MGSQSGKRSQTGRANVDVDALLQEALHHHRSGQLREAEAGYRKILDINPRDEDALHLLGVLAFQVGRHDIAIDLIGKAIQYSPSVPYYHDNMGNALKAAGRVEEAVSSYLKALELQPDYAQARSNLGTAFKSLGRLEEAVDQYRQALKSKPDLVETHNNLGNALKEQGKIEEAIISFRKALQMKPDYADAMNNLGSALHDRGEIEEAVRHFADALRIKPDMAEAMNNLGIALQHQGKIEEAIISFRRALQIKPEYPEGLNNLGSALKDQGDIEGAISHYGRALEIRPDYPGAHSNYLLALHYDERADRSLIFKESTEWSKKYCPFSPHTGAFGNRPDPERKIRIGYVSGDFRRHPVAYFIEGPLTFHDRERFEVYCYSNHHMCDEVTRKIQALPVLWRSVAGLSDEDAERMIKTDGIDILVDLSGHTAGHRLQVFARKAAPVQATWIGYSDTTGLTAMDYIIADRYVIPKEDEGFYAEGVARLPHSYLCYTPVAYAPETGALPAMSRGHVTFGSFNNIAKVGPRAIKTWARIMEAVPGSRLCIKTSLDDLPVVRERYVRMLGDHGIEEKRIDVIGKSLNHKELLALYGNIDIALDTFPYAGTTTTVEALWMGLPVVSLGGDSFVGRVGLSILSSAGLEEFVAHTADEYVEIAKGLAGDMERLSSLRTGLRDRVRHSPLCDAAWFTRDLERAFRRMWETWCAERALR